MILHNKQVFEQLWKANILEQAKWQCSDELQEQRKKLALAKNYATLQTNNRRAGLDTNREDWCARAKLSFGDHAFLLSATAFTSTRDTCALLMEMTSNKNILARYNQLNHNSRAQVQMAANLHKIQNCFNFLWCLKNSDKKSNKKNYHLYQGLMNACESLKYVFEKKTDLNVALMQLQCGDQTARGKKKGVTIFYNTLGACTFLCISNLIRVLL